MGYEKFRELREYSDLLIEAVLESREIILDLKARVDELENRLGRQ